MEKNKIFISHRHADTQSDCRGLKSELQRHFGKDKIFFDIETILPGSNYIEVIKNTLKQSKVVLVVIGPDWAGPKDEKGLTRIFQENDWVRREVSEALVSSGTRVIPILMKNAAQPEAKDLPENLQRLVELQTMEIWDYDVKELIKVLENFITPIIKTEEKIRINPIPSFITPKPKSWWARNYLWVLGLFIVLMIIMISSDEFQKGYQEEINGTSDSNDDPIENIDQQADNSISQSEINSLREENPSGNEIYNDLQVDEDPTPNQPAQAGFDYSGKWWLREEGVRMGYFLINQNGNYFNFDYYYFDQKVGEGTGEYDGTYLYSTLFKIYDDPKVYGFSFGSIDGGISWYGQTFNNNLPANAELIKD